MCMCYLALGDSANIHNKKRYFVVCSNWDGTLCSFIQIELKWMGADCSAVLDLPVLVLGPVPIRCPLCQSAQIRSYIGAMTRAHCGDVMEL